MKVENVYIGAKPDGIDPCASGEITSLELYTAGNTAPENVLPEPLRTMLIMDQNNAVSGKTPTKRSHSPDKDSTMENKKEKRIINLIKYKT